MKKVVLLEDRYKRQEDFLELSRFDLKKYSDVITNVIGDTLVDQLESILNNTIDFDKYDIVIVHKSIEYKESNPKIIKNLKEYCQTHKKALVLFSGGVSVNYYNNDSFECLELNSKTFYSRNLRLFLESIKDDNENILMLCYGNQWKLNTTANILEKINLFLNQLNMDEDIEYTSLLQKVDVHKLSQIDYDFYNMEIEDGWVFRSEIENLRDSVKSYCSVNHPEKVAKSDEVSLLIHNNNIVDIQSFSNRIRFTTDEDVDKYIAEYIIGELQNREYEKIFIKDNLSSSYLELLGLRLALHIRLTKELNDQKRNAPIVIISDFDVETLNSFSSEARILFTDGIYLCKNNQVDIDKYKTYQLRAHDVKHLNKFLDVIKVERPKDSTGSHDVANKWSISRWASALNVRNETIKNNNCQIESSLYFKYLSALYLSLKPNEENIKTLTKKGNVLLIDDEWHKGWSDILKKIFSTNGLKFKTFEYDFKDKSNFNLIVQLQYKELRNLVQTSDVIVLDLRLLQCDYDRDNIDNYSGLKILQKIHEINAGIQVVMLTATSQSTILEKLYDNKILGYVKKEHPSETNFDTVKNINKLVSLVDEGLERKYLKEIYEITLKITNILNIDFELSKEEIECGVFAKFNLPKKHYVQFAIKLHQEALYVFEILDSKIKNRFIYAILSIVSSFEAINSIFIQENRYENDKFWDGKIVKNSKLSDKIEELYNRFENTDSLNIEKMIRQRNNYLHSNPKKIQVELKDILQIYSAELKFLDAINKKS